MKLEDTDTSLRFNATFADKPNESQAMRQTLRNIWNFYEEGFRSMSPTARTLWLIIFVKLFIMFAILKVFFFPAELSQYETEEQKTEAVIQNLTGRPQAQP